MFLDIIAGIIIVGSMAAGFRRGFFHTVLHTAGWVLALVASFALSPAMKAAMIKNPNIFTPIHQSLLDRLSDALLSRQLANTLPDLLENAIQALIGQTAEAAALMITDLIISIISFLFVLFAVKLILWVVASAFSKKRRRGAIGAVDSLIGLSLGFIKGMIVVFILLAFMVLVAGLSDPKYTDFIMEGLRSSYFTGTLYDNNLIILIVRDFLP